MASNKSVKCKICGKKYVSKQALIDHIEKAHSANIPEGWNAARYENYLRTGKTEGKCVYCGKETGWNDTTGKYNRMCGSEACKKKARELANKNYIGKHGKPYTINDPEQQKKMVYGRKNSGKYIFEDEETGKKYVAMYDSSYGRDFLEMLDTFLNWDGADIIAPSPHTYYYEYEGKKHFYIPDVYSTSLNLEIELKDGGDNPNMHPKIQAVDKVKEKKKDEVMESLKGQVNYIKICNKDYTEFFALLSSLKEKDTCQLPKWESKLESISESMVSTVTEGIGNNYRLFIKRQKLLRDPMLNYDDLMKYYRKRLFHDNLSKSEWDALYNELNQVRDYLKAVINDNHNESNKRMNYEAKKALQQVEGFIIYMEDQNQIPVKESVGSNKVPFYIVSWDYDSMVGGGVKLITKSQYNHTSIALTPNLEDCYTFSRNPETVKSHRTNGFCKESLSYMVNRYGDANIKVDAVYVSKSEYNKLKKNIDEYIKRQENTSFDYINFAYSAFKIPREELDEDKLNCSVFVDLLLKKSGIDLTNGKNSNLVTPGDLSELDSKHKDITTVYVGKASEYNQNNKGINRYNIDSEFLEKGDTCYNLDKWSVDNQNILYITGISGSGKTTLAKDLMKEFDCYRVELDYISAYYLLRTKTQNRYSNLRKKICSECPVVSEYLDSHNPDEFGYPESFSDTEPIINSFMKWFTDRVKNNGNLYIVNGAQIYCWIDFEYFIDKPIIIKDINWLKSTCRRFYREYDEDGKFADNVVNSVKSLKISFSKSYISDNIKLYKQNRYLNKYANVSESTFIEATKDEEHYYPVFIFLSYTGTNMAKMIKSFTHDPYSHSSLSFDTELTNMVSFNREGMVTENIKDGLWKERAASIKYSLYIYLATAEEYDAMRNFVNELLSKRANLKYNILGLTNFVFGRGSDREDKFFCSEFVAATINAGDKKVIKTKPYMTSPYMLAKNKNFKFIKKGLVKNYNPKVVDNIIQDYLEGGGYEDVTIR